MMKRICRLVLLLAVAFAFVRGSALAQVKQLSGKQLDAALPKSFYLEGNAIPTEKLNSVMIRTSHSPRVLFALIDTAGYSSEVQEKYIGMMITEGKLQVCGHTLGVGSYGFGLERPGEQSNAAARFHVYDQAGTQLFVCAAPKDTKLARPRPLEVVTGASRLYLGRYWLSIK